MKVTVADLIGLMENVAPSALAEEWDNVGLQVGKTDWPVNEVWLALDPLSEVIEAACRAKVGLLITHHPLIFKPLAAVKLDDPIADRVARALAGRLAVFTAHTNFDRAAGGLNDLLAERIGLTNILPLSPFENHSRNYKLAVFVPLEHEERILEALFETEAGIIEDYRKCSFRVTGKGTFEPGADARPAVGSPGRLNEVKEVKIEAVVSAKQLRAVIDKLRARHPYQSMACDVIPLFQPPGADGMGRVGELPEPTSLQNLARNLRTALGLKRLRFAGDPTMTVRRVALCSGSGSSLLRDFLASSAEVYISGDFRYHDARDVEAAGRGMVDVGHFASEYIMVEALAERLAAEVRKAGMAVRVKPCTLERDPFIYL